MSSLRSFLRGRRVGSAWSTAKLHSSNFPSASEFLLKNLSTRRQAMALRVESATDVRIDLSEGAALSQSTTAIHIQKLVSLLVHREAQRDHRAWTH